MWACHTVLIRPCAAVRRSISSFLTAEWMHVWLCHKCGSYWRAIRIVGSKQASWIFSDISKEHWDIQTDIHTTNGSMRWILVVSWLPKRKEGRETMQCTAVGLSARSVAQLIDEVVTDDHRQNYGYSHDDTISQYRSWRHNWCGYSMV